MKDYYPGIGLVVDKQCPWCLNTRVLIQHKGHGVRMRCTMNGEHPNRSLPYCGYDATVVWKELTDEEKILFRLPKRKDVV